MKVKVVIDRPKGTYHPEHHDLYYPIHYGYVPDVIGGDTEEQDAYLIDVNQPVQEYVGELIAIVHRIDDYEDKWVVAPFGSQYLDEYIEAKISFQEQYFRHFLSRQLLIRKATPNDISRIAEILVFSKRVAYRSMFQDDKSSFHDLQVIKEINKYQQQLELLKNIYVYDDGIIKGILDFIIIDETLEIRQLYIEPFFQKIGIGHEFMQFINIVIHSFSIQTVGLWVIEKNLLAITFYEKHGFYKTKQRESVTGTNEYQVYMRRKII